MHLGLNRKVAMVAGASRGLGLGVARALAAEGATVSMASRDAARVEAAAASIAEETKADVMGVAADVRSA
ncbi:MAG: 3-oxoacyl-ACP reductase, partial [Acidobacteria bacterium]